MSIIILTPPQPPKPPKSAPKEVKDAWVKAHLEAMVAEMEDPAKPMPTYSYAISDGMT